MSWAWAKLDLQVASQEAVQRTETRNDMPLYGNLVSR